MLNDLFELVDFVEKQKSDVGGLCDYAFFRFYSFFQLLNASLLHLNGSSELNDFFLVIFGEILMLQHMLVENLLTHQKRWRKELVLSQNSKIRLLK